ncbi:MAG: hypothetical protein ACK5NN_08465 [Sphingomonadaceae bacterium]
MGRLGFGFGRYPLRPYHRESMILLADGWAISASDADSRAGASISCQRSGFDQSGVPVLHNESVHLTTRVRLPWPDQDTYTDDQVVLSDYIYSTDLVAGASNASITTSPKPVAAWLMPDRLLVQGSLHWELVAFHRDARPNSAGAGQQIACVRVRAGDGTSVTDWQVAGETVISTLCDDPNPVEVYAGDLDISGLNDGLVTLEAEIFPWLGDGSSVLKSADQPVTDRRAFSNRIFRKGPVPAYAYVASTGNDSSGTAHALAATASASPCLSVAGALKKLHDFLGTAQGALDGAVIRIMDSVICGTPQFTGSYRQDIASVVIEAAPGVAASTAIVTMAANFNPDFDSHTIAVNEGALMIRGVTWKLSGVRSFQGPAGIPLHVQFHNCIINMENNSSDLRGGAHISIFGAEILNVAGTANLLGIAGLSDQIRTLRGVTCDNLNGQSPDAHTMVGCALGNPGQMAFLTPDDGMLVYNNAFNSCSRHLMTINASANTVTISRLVVVQNLIEWTGSNSAYTAMALMTNTGNSCGAIIHHNTVAGAAQGGRSNLLFDGFATTPARTDQTHDLASLKGNLFSQVNFKGDVFVMDGSLTGYFPLTHGAGCAGNFSEYAANAPATEHPFHGGPGTVYNASTTMRANPLFSNDQSSQWDYGTGAIVAGAGGGTYTLQAGSPAQALLANPVLGYDLAGAVRGAGMQAAGAYAKLQ